MWVKGPFLWVFAEKAQALSDSSLTQTKICLGLNLISWIYAICMLFNCKVAIDDFLPVVKSLGG